MLLCCSLPRIMVWRWLSASGILFSAGACWVKTHDTSGRMVCVKLEVVAVSMLKVLVVA
jgi:hypothetical protein